MRLKDYKHMVIAPAGPGVDLDEAFSSEKWDSLHKSADSAKCLLCEMTLFCHCRKWLYEGSMYISVPPSEVPKSGEQRTKSPDSMCHTLMY